MSFVFSSPAPDPPLEGAGLESDCGRAHPAGAGNGMPNLDRPGWQGSSSKKSFEVQTFPFLKRREIEIVLYRQWLLDQRGSGAYKGRFTIDLIWHGEGVTVDVNVHCPECELVS